MLSTSHSCSEMNPLQNVAITGRERVGSVASVNPHYSVLSGLPLVSFSSLIMSKLSWQTEERKTRKFKIKNPCWEPTNQKVPQTMVKSWRGHQYSGKREELRGQRGGGGEKQVGEARVREGWEGWSSAVLCLRHLIQTDWIAFSCRACHSASSVGF